jgi:hypothetical protein
MTLTEKYAERHPSTLQVLRWLVPNPNLPMVALTIANQIELTADMMVGHCPDGPELTTGLRKLLEAKDCLVRAVLA